MSGARGSAHSDSKGHRLLEVEDGCARRQGPAATPLLLQGHGDSERTTGSPAGSTINFELFAAPNLLEAQRRKRASCIFCSVREVVLHLCIELARGSHVVG